MQYTSKLTKPPYSQRLAVLLSTADYAQISGAAANGTSLSIFVIAGSKGWDIARELERTHAILLAPYDENPEHYDWSILAGHDPIHIRTEGTITQNQMFTLAQALDRDGVNRILYPKGDGSAMRYLSQRVIQS